MQETFPRGEVKKNLLEEKTLELWCNLTQQNELRFSCLVGIELNLVLSLTSTVTFDM